MELDLAFLELVYRLHGVLKRAVPPRGSHNEPVRGLDANNALRWKAKNLLAEGDATLRTLLETKLAPRLDTSPRAGNLVATDVSPAPDARHPGSE